jgi:hypothetical protein
MVMPEDEGNYCILNELYEVGGFGECRTPVSYDHSFLSDGLLHSGKK